MHKILFAQYCRLDSIKCSLVENGHFNAIKYMCIFWF